MYSPVSIATRTATAFASLGLTLGLLSALVGCSADGTTYGNTHAAPTTGVYVIQNTPASGSTTAASGTILQFSTAATGASTPTATLRRRLLALPGVGPETADAILLYALNHAVPVADEYLRRIAERHQLLAPRSRGYKLLADLTRQSFATDPPASHTRLFNEFHALTVAVGKAHCGRTARCDECPLAEDLQLAKESESWTQKPG